MSGNVKLTGAREDAEGNQNSSITNNLLNYELPCLTTEYETVEETDTNASEDEFCPHRTKTSARDATYVVAATVQKAGISLEKVSLSKSTIHRKHMIKNQDVKLVVEWDGMLLPIVKGKDVDRLPILVKGDNIDHLLGVRKSVRGTGKN
ncbi:hypothetical protein TSAR_000097 [Trichomalopsis sarcophagae]|uniref:Uncharacterized protein n=1 Tax=Trichomalopsis sarcophagae TaxID=543379 RepID=A0A232EL65_9HYME|nr:hypothetical protein TSAR_000097 [Trichomalopsis sarcophagae]